MFFYYQHSLTNPKNIRCEKMDGDNYTSQPKPQVLYLQAGNQQIIHLSHGSNSLILLGDPVYSRLPDLKSFLSDSGDINANYLIEKIKGHYIWFYIQKSSFSCGASFAAIFPVYYTLNKSAVVLCSSSLYLAKHEEQTTRDKKNMLERLLFNYPLFNSSWWEEIKLLRTHHSIKIHNHSVKEERFFNIRGAFGPILYRNKAALHDLVDQFGRETNQFFPDEKFAVSFTGGFDGRTLVAAAMQSKKQFFTYSFGRSGISDITVPAQQSRKISIDYMPIRLDQNYVDQHAFRSAIEFSKLTEYNGNLHRPHYYYAAERLSQKVNYIITGNFGSELFRALHNPGVMMSEDLINVFSCPDNAWKDQLTQKVNCWGINHFDEALEMLITEIEAYLISTSGLTMNHRFYAFVYEEIFRKYFGAEIVMQSHFLNNRTPYLNLQFIRSLNKTLWSGIHSKIFEKKKVRRMKGQIFYSAFIKEMAPSLYYLKTNKGYRPADVFDVWRLPLLITGFVNKKFFDQQEVDNNADNMVFKNHHQQILNQHIDVYDPFLKYFMRGNEQEISTGKNLEKWLKMYSIAMGWSLQVNRVPV